RAIGIGGLGQVVHEVEQVLAVLVHERDEQLLLGAEVVVERALRAAELGGDLRHRRGAVSAGQERLARHGDDRAALGVAARALLTGAVLPRAIRRSGVWG